MVWYPIVYCMYVHIYMLLEPHSANESHKIYRDTKIYDDEKKKNGHLPKYSDKRQLPAIFPLQVVHKSISEQLLSLTLISPVRGMI